MASISKLLSNNIKVVLGLFCAAVLGILLVSGFQFTSVIWISNRIAAAPAVPPHILVAFDTNMRTHAGPFGLRQLDSGVPVPQAPIQDANTPANLKLPFMGPKHARMSTPNRMAFASSLAGLFSLAIGILIRWNRRIPELQSMSMATSAGAFEATQPPLVEAINEINETEARRALQYVTRVPVIVPDHISSEPIMTSFLGPCYPNSCPLECSSNQTAVVLLHGFDSNCLEWRWVLPRLTDRKLPSYAFDILGWGFAERSPSIKSYSPEAKRLHLYHFWQQYLGGRPMVLVGASVGGAMAIDFAYHYPEAVERLVLVAPQCFIDGVPRLPTPLAWLGIQLLKSRWLRAQVTWQAYNTKDFGDAMLVGRLHTLMDRYDDSAVAFIQSGGYTVSSLVSQLKVPTLIIWGRQDQILPPSKYLDKLRAVLPTTRIAWIEDGGHVPHCTQPEEFVETLIRFVRPERAA